MGRRIRSILLTAIAFQVSMSYTLGELRFREQVVIDNLPWLRSEGIVDLDGDGDLDYVGFDRDDGVLVYLNDGEEFPTFSELELTGNDLENGITGDVLAADFDLDGDYDIVASMDISPDPAEVVFRFLANDGSQNPLFTTYYVDVNEYIRMYNMNIADLDGDNDIDIFYDRYSNNFYWYENAGDSLVEHYSGNNSNIFRNGRSEIFDFDQDGDLDVFSPLHDEDAAFFMQRNDGDQELSFTESFLIDDYSYGHCIKFSDLDDDGDYDFIGSVKNNNENIHHISWWENTDIENLEFTEHLIKEFSQWRKATDFEFCDINQDGLIDFLAMVNRTQFRNHIEETIRIYINEGNVEFSEYILTVDNGIPELIHFADINGDETGDIITSLSGRISWWEMYETVPPDSFSLISPPDDTLYYFEDFSFTWQRSFNPDPEAVINYVLYLAEDSLSLPDNPVAETTDTTVTINIDESGTYFWTVTASVIDIELTRANEIWSFNAHVCSPPEPFDLIYPDHNHISHSFDVDLEWESSTDTDEGNEITYEVYISDTYDGVETALFTITNLTSAMFTIDIVESYWWSVKALDGNSHGRWANQTNRFFIEDIPPEPFNLLFPDDGYISELENVNLTWESTIDPDEGDDIIYEVYCSQSLEEVETSLFLTTPLITAIFTGESENDYWWTVKAIDGNSPGTWASQVYMFSISETAVDYQNDNQIPTEFQIDSIFPNPFNNLATIRVGLPSPGYLEIDLFNLQGQEVLNLASGDFAPGYHEFALDGSVFPTGIYFLRAFVPGELNETRKVLLLK